MKTTNPFIINDYFRPEYFCDRENEVELILSKLERNENLLLISKNGIGKTTLIQHIYHIIKKKKVKNLVYIDLLFYSTFNKFVTKFFKIVLNSKSKKFERQVKDIFFSSKGNDSLSLDDNSDSTAIDKYQQLLTFINSRKKSTIITIDNYEIIAEYGLKNFTKTILNPILSANNISLILLGTEKIFSSDNCEEIVLGSIDKDFHEKFIINLFQKDGKTFSKKALSKIFEWSLGNTSVIQLLCSKLWCLNKQKIKTRDVNNAIDQILRENYKNFSTFHKLLSPYQWNLFVTIASQSEPFQITSSSFIKEHGLNAPSSVNTAIKALETKGMIYRKGKTYHVADVIICHSMENLPVF